MIRHCLRPLAGVRGGYRTAVISITVPTTADRPRCRGARGTGVLPPARRLPAGGEHRPPGGTRVSWVWTTWQQAMQAALYGPGGFYARGERPAAHFRTSVHTSPRYAAAVLALLREVDAALGQPAQLDLVDVGAGQGELLSQVLAAAGPPLAGRLVPHAAELAPRPPGLDQRIRWAPVPPSRDHRAGHRQRVAGQRAARRGRTERGRAADRAGGHRDRGGAQRARGGPGRPGLAAPLVAAAPPATEPSWDGRAARRGPG